MTTGKPTPVELAAAAIKIQRTIDGLVSMNEAMMHTPGPLATRRAMRARLVVCDRLSKTLARIIANGSPTASPIDESAGELEEAR